MKGFSSSYREHIFLCVISVYTPKTIFFLLSFLISFQSNINSYPKNANIIHLYAIYEYIFLFLCLCIDCLHLQLYRDSKDRYKQGQTKASLSLQHFLGVESGFTLDKESNTIAIICQDVIVVLAFDTRERLIQWQVKNFLSFLFGYTHTRVCRNSSITHSS